MPRTISTTANTRRTLTPSDARRAIYLDFEGFENAAPALLGVLVEDTSEILVLDPALQPAADARGLRVVDGAVALRGILQRARLEGRLICGFCDREREAALEDFGVDLAEHFVNVQPRAKRWWKRSRDERPKRRRRGSWARDRGYSLRFFEKGLGLERPPHLATGNATKRLRDVRDMLVRHEGDWSRLTGTAKAKWTKLLNYNETDVRNLAALACRVAGEAG